MKSSSGNKELPLAFSSAPTTTSQSHSFASRKGVFTLFLFSAIAYAVLPLAGVSGASDLIHSLLRPKYDEQCIQASVLIPEKNTKLWGAVNGKISTEEYKRQAIDWLAGAIKIPTESFDDMGPVGEDPRWEIHRKLHDYLLSAFPVVHTTLKLTKINTYGLLYEWKGSDTSLKPLLLAGHQDVVPVESTTIDKWTHPPFSGHYDGTRIWGRGTADDKSGVVGILSAIETLLKAEFQPARTVLLAFGFDEEIGGFKGAKFLADHLLKSYGKNSIAFMVDEGGIFVQEYGSVFAAPGIAEKGSVNTRIQVAAPGGHSSIPPVHTSIGILSSLLVHVESNPFDARLDRTDPMYSTLQCVAEHAKDIPTHYRKLIQRSVHSDGALRAVQKIAFQNPIYKSLVGTTQAIDVIQGGAKSNALPEQAWAIVNHRISVISSVKETQDHDANLLKKLASKFNLTYTAFGELISEEGAPSSGSLVLDTGITEGGLEPAPVSPTGKDAIPYQVLSGTIKATYNVHRSLPTKDVDAITVAPGMMSGNTDTRFYWDLTPHIFRYTHRSAGNETNMLAGLHTVNESLEADSFLEMIRFFVTLILNADESNQLQ
ncbi:carboxypeptidase S [Cyathus striatus]|nr:carboxypeptidase S [Cyathus striatus]